MKKLLWCSVLLLFLLPSCNSGGHRVTVVKPKVHKRFYDRKNDKRMPRTKKVKMKG